MKRLLSIFFFMLLVSMVSAQSKYSNAFLSLGIGARGLSMANTMVALSDDVTSAYWNPAGLSRMTKRFDASLMHAEYFAGIAKYDYAGVGYKVDNSFTVALSYIRFGIDNLMNTTELIDNQGNVDYNKISYFSTSDNAVMLSCAYQFENIQGLALGANAKVIYRNIGKFAHAWGFGFDFGLQYCKKGWQAAFMLQDATSTFNAWRYQLTDDVIDVFHRTGNEIPENGLELTIPSLLVGGAKYVELGKGFNASFALGADLTFDGKRSSLVRSKVLSMDPHFGMEWGYKKIVCLRAGIGNFQQEMDFDGSKKTSLQISLGVGVSIKNTFFIDYAFTDIGDLSIAQYSNVISLRVAIDKFKIRNK